MKPKLLLLHSGHQISNNNYSRGMSAAATAASPLLFGDTFWLDSFALRQWDDPNYGGTRIDYDKQKFLNRVHEAFHESGGKLVDGYAPFCKHVFLPNFVEARLGSLEITDNNRHLLRSGYTKRRPEELAVLTRWFSTSELPGGKVPVAESLDIILYSREQLVKEYDDMPSAKGSSNDLPEGVPWGIISIKAQNEMHETPMQPITMLRNSLGREEGGSGVAIDREKYAESVAYWDRHATIVDGAHPNGE